MSSTARRNDNKGLDTDRPPLRESDSRDRFSFRNKVGDGENDRMRDTRNNTLRPKRAEGDQDSDGWSTVKPRKSFGTEGAERFNGRMGVDRHRDDRRFKDREDRDTKDRPARGFENFSRDSRAKDGEHDHDKDNHRNGVGRARNDSWFRGDNDGPAPAPRERNSNGDRFANRGWREKNDDQDRGNRNDRGDRRWDRDRNERNEPEPAWMDEPAEEKSQAHTQEDFQKWKEAQQNKDKGGKTVPEEPKAESGGGFFGLEKPKFETPLAIDAGPDKFFGMWATPKDENGPDSAIESKKGDTARAKTVGKASRFTSFFTPAQEEPPRRSTEPPPPLPAAPPGGLGALFQNSGQGSGDASEKEAFQQLLQKLQRQTVSVSGSTPPANVSQQPKPPASEKQQSQPIPGLEPFQQYRPKRHEETRPPTSSRNSQQALQDLLGQRQAAGSQPTVRPEQMLQELVGQRQNALSQSSARPDQPQNRTNTDFLMNLMKGQPEPQRSEQLMLRMPGNKPVDRQVDRSMDQQIQEHQLMERERELQREAAARERSTSQRQGRPPPGFFDDAFQQRGPPPQHDRPQPTQILQRPPPPGLDQMQPGWAPPSQLPPPQQLRQQQQYIAPPPGLAGRGMPPMPQQMFPPGFPGMVNFPPPDPRGMPPPGFLQGPPPGFIPPGFHGPEGMAFGGPFDGRGPPPNGAFRR